MSYLFTSESVSEGHPDKVADAISDAVLDLVMAKEDSALRCACETLVTTNRVIVAGEYKGVLQSCGAECLFGSLHDPLTKAKPPKNPWGV